ncbi:hypothetical protein B7486_04105 [cyanobacterium TDX16]|nr:hypothetical protein B7486_04105 [cyanobacterium TDX16]
MGGFAGRGGNSHLFRFHSSGKGVFDRCDKGFRGNGGRHACCEAYDLSGSDGPAAPGIGERFEEDFPMLRRFVCMSAGVVGLAVVHTALAGPVLDIDPDLMGIPRGGIVVDHQPHPTGGPAADMDFRDDFGTALWQQSADNFSLSQNAIIRHVTWWGFYGSSFTSPAEQPPVTQTMRVSFYEARIQDGLPGTVLFEETFVDPSYAWTGRQVLTGAAPNEYKFDVDLTTPVTLRAMTAYWLEIVQLGGQQSHYRWEYSRSGEINGFAVQNLTMMDWFHSQSITSDLAFQLSTIPEPGTAALFGIASMVFIQNRRRRSSPC